jgi:mono/diheme cytochrome c family protein
VKYVWTAIGTLAAVLVVSFGLMMSGCYDVGATNHDNAFLNWFLDRGMTRSVEHHSRNIVPPDLTAQELQATGAAHYREMCVSCHGAPGAPAGEIAEGLWPEAPDLSTAVEDWTPAQLFWIVKHGIKFTAMPGWGESHTDEQVWAIVAFLEELPHITPANYRALADEAGSEEGGRDERGN